MKRDGDQTDVAEIFAALGDRTRLRLVSSLLDSPSQSVTQLTRGVPLTRQAVRKHLAVLQKARLVRVDRVGRESRFAIEPGALNQARVYLERAASQWEQALARLKDFLGE